MTALRESQEDIAADIANIYPGEEGCTEDAPGEAVLVSGHDLPTVTRAYVDQTVAQSVDARFAQQLADQRIPTAVVTGVIVGVIITWPFCCGLSACTNHSPAPKRAEAPVLWRLVAFWHSGERLRRAGFVSVYAYVGEPNDPSLGPLRIGCCITSGNR